MAMPKCPNCGSADDVAEGRSGDHRCDKCQYYWISCPTCGEVISYMLPGMAEDMPCRHVAVRFNSDDLFWEGGKLEREFEKYVEENDHGDRCRDAFDDFLEKEGLVDTVTIKDYGSHGSCFETFVFKNRAGKHEPT
jgi:rRNA maturation protein Nop10